MKEVCQDRSKWRAVVTKCLLNNNITCDEKENIVRKPAEESFQKRTKFQITLYQNVMNQDLIATQ